MNGKIRVGCGVWSNKNWIGTLYSPNTSLKNCLAEYANIFTAVEGNSTFYGLPSPDTVYRWLNTVPVNFRFCFKAPRTVTHEKGLVNAQKPFLAFLRRISPLGGNLGPIMLQFPRTFGPSQIPQLLSFLSTLPKDFIFTVELRHPDLLSTADYTNRLVNEQVSMCIVDARILTQSKPQRSNIKKIPDLGVSPIIRFVGSENIKQNDPFLTQWAILFEHWTSARKSPYFFAHTNTDNSAPELVKRFQNLSPGLLPSNFRGANTQLDLFDQVSM